MKGKLLINVDDILTLGDDSDAATRAVYDLADELNSALPGMLVTFCHWDTGNFLCFEGPNVRRELTKPCPRCECEILRNETFCPECLTRFDRAVAEPVPFLAKIGSGEGTVKGARVVPAEKPDIGGYFVVVLDSTGREGLLIDACNLPLDDAQSVAHNALGQPVELWV